MLKKQYKIFAVIFCVVLFFLGVLGDYKLQRYYVYDEMDYNEWTVDAGDKLESQYASNFYKKIQFVNLQGLTSRILGQHKLNGVVRMKNGYLMQEILPADEIVLKDNADSVKDLENYISQWGGKLLYVTVPYIVDKYDPELPEEITDNGNRNLDIMRENIENLNIPSLDLREAIHDAGVSQYDLWYKTDHHWSTKGGFFAYTLIADYLQENEWAEIDEEVCNLENYTIETYPKWHLGSNGQRTGIYYAGIDDFDLILPNFDTYIENINSGVSGRFEEVCINKTELSNRNYESRYTYDHVMGGSGGNYNNYNAKSDKKILVIGDSMSSAVCPYIILSFQEMRYAGNWVTPVITKQQLDEWQPDIVVMMYYPNRVISEDGYKFQLE